MAQKGAGAPHHFSRELSPRLARSTNRARQKAFALFALVTEPSFLRVRLGRTTSLVRPQGGTARMQAYAHVGGFSKLSGEAGRDLAVYHPCRGNVQLGQGGSNRSIQKA
jgi:hypothetical protein